ncbi:MAG: hypothetical protein LQ348_004516 [Seirophora lacunosa]|nr:MAG: hypothetical protein LQ348_004516 [Seirophora lacunosa]
MAASPNSWHAEKAQYNAEKRSMDSQSVCVEAAEDVHSVFHPLQRKLIVLTASTAALLSPLSSNIYLPALNLIATDLHVSDSQINLTVTSYLIFQALSPTLVASWSDSAGRRPAYIACFTLCLGANVALTMRSDYMSLLLLRCLQSAGSSALVALCQGIVADVATVADRGTYVAYASVSTILGPTAAPILGGLLSQYFGWRAIFCFLALFAALIFAFILLFLPETCRSVVGNGSMPPPHIVHLTLFAWLRRKQRLRRCVHIDAEGEEDEKHMKSHSASFLSPLATLAILLNKEASLLMCFVGIIFGIHYLILSAVPSQYGDLYGLDEITLGLVYIPYGLGSILSAFTTGRLANWNYRRHAMLQSHPTSMERQPDLTDFPVERARLEIALPILYISSALIVIYGWSLDFHIRLPGSMLLLFGVGYSVYALYQLTSLLILDLFPENPATATAANNLIRCSFAATSAACAVPLVEWLGVGWAYTLAGFSAIGASLILGTLMIHGPAWRREMALRNRLEHRPNGPNLAD